MLKRTRKWAFVEQEAKRLTVIGLSSLEISKRLGVAKSTVTRWMASGKLSRPEVPGGPVITLRPGHSPAEWAMAVRGAYDLDATDDQLVTLAEAALGVSSDFTVAAHVRMAASGRFQAIVRQLALVARSVKAEQEKAADTPEPAQRQKNPVIRRSSVDPRRILMAVK